MGALKGRHLRSGGADPERPVLAGRAESTRQVTEGACRESGTWPSDGAEIPAGSLCTVQRSHCLVSAPTRAAMCCGWSQVYHGLREIDTMCSQSAVYLAGRRGLEQSKASWRLGWDILLNGHICHSCLPELPAPPPASSRSLLVLGLLPLPVLWIELWPAGKEVGHGLKGARQPFRIGHPGAQCTVPGFGGLPPPPASSAWQGK